jgi:hypothetical protein
MFGLLTRAGRKKKVPAPRRARLGLECLESRDAPSTLTMSVAYGSGRGITLSGALTGTPCPAGQTVRISGQAAGLAVTDSGGHYTINLVASGLGPVSGKTVDGSSNTAQVTLTDTAPVLTNLKACEGVGDLWTFSGTVTYRSPQGLTVSFGGQPVTLQGKITPVSYTGTFSLSIRLNGTSTDNGMVSAGVMDPWGLTSNTLEVNVQQMGT